MRRVHGHDAPAVLEPLGRLVAVLQDVGDVRGAVDATRDMLAVLRCVCGADVDDEDVAAAMDLLAALLGTLSETDEAARLQRESQEMTRRLQAGRKT